MFTFTIRNANFLNDFYAKFNQYLNKSYKFSMLYLSNPAFAEYKDNERLVLLALNKSIFQNLLSFLRLNDSNMQFSAFACLESAVNSIRLYKVLVNKPEYMHSFITKEDFVMEMCESEIADKITEYNPDYHEDFSLKEFANALKKINIFVYKTNITAQLNDGGVYLGLSCGDNLSQAMQDEIRKNLIGAYLSLQIHTKQFFNGGIDEEFEKLEDEINAKFLEYIKLYSTF